MPAAVARAVAMAMLGGFSGYVVRSPWALALVPVAYISAVTVKLARGQSLAVEAPRHRVLRRLLCLKPDGAIYRMLQHVDTLYS
jgi:hypothetical protein